MRTRGQGNLGTNLGFKFGINFGKVLIPFLVCFLLGRRFQKWNQIWFQIWNQFWSREYVVLRGTRIDSKFGTPLGAQKMEPILKKNRIFLKRRNFFSKKRNRFFIFLVRKMEPNLVRKMEPNLAPTKFGTNFMNHYVVRCRCGSMYACLPVCMSACLHVCLCVLFCLSFHEAYVCGHIYIVRRERHIYLCILTYMRTCSHASSHTYIQTSTKCCEDQVTSLGR